MSIDGTDLRDAFDPLAGDPVADAARVLGGLPKPGIPPVAWWLLAAGLAVGVLLGPWLFGRDEKKGEQPVLEKKEPEDSEDKDEKRKDDGGPEKEKKPPEDEWANVMFHGFGRVIVRQTDSSKETLTDEHMVSYGSTFETGKGQAGMLLAYEVQLRLDKETIARVVEPERIVLREGQLWVYTGEIPDGTVAIQTPLGVVDVTGGAVNVDYRDGRLQVLCLSGEVAVDTGAAAGALALRPGTMGSIEDGERDGPVKVPFVPSYTSWMTKMVVRQQDRAELEKRIKRVVDAYFGREHPEAARQELIRMGTVTVPSVVDRYRSTISPTQKFARDTARLVCNMAERSTMKWVFDLLYDPDPEVRVIAFTRAFQITEVSEGTGDEFWRREDNAAERAEVIQKWWKAVN